MSIVKGPNVEKITDKTVVDAILKRAKSEKNLDLINRCIRQRAILEGREHDDPLLAELWTAVNALEAARTEEAGKTIRLSRTRQVMAKKSAHEILSGWALAKSETDGFSMLKDRAMLDLSGEAIILRHAERFDEEIVEAARSRLKSAGYTQTSKNQ